MKRMARIHATATTPGALFEYDILDPNSAPGWLFLHKIVEKPTVAGPNGKVPPPRTELVAGIPPSMTTFVEFYVGEARNEIYQDNKHADDNLFDS